MLFSRQQRTLTSIHSEDKRALLAASVGLTDRIARVYRSVVSVSSVGLGFKYQVERRLRGSPEVIEATRGDNLAQTRLASLCP